MTAVLAAAGVPLETVGCIAVFAVTVGLLIGHEVARPWRPPSDRRRRELDQLIDENGVRE